MRHEKLTFSNGVSVIHCVSVYQMDVSLCGHDLSGDTSDFGKDYEYGNDECTDSWYQSEHTDEPINCKDCIDIIEYCKTVKKAEYTNKKKEVGNERS